MPITCLVVILGCLTLVVAGDGGMASTIHATMQILFHEYQSAGVLGVQYIICKDSLAVNRLCSATQCPPLLRGVWLHYSPHLSEYVHLSIRYSVCWPNTRFFGQLPVFSENYDKDRHRKEFNNWGNDLKSSFEIKKLIFANLLPF